MDRFDPFVKYADVYGDIINWEKDPMNKPQNQNKYFFSDGKTYYEQICKMLRLMSVFKEAFNQIYTNEDTISEAWENFVNNLSASVVEGSEPDVTLTWTDDSVNFEFTMVPGVPGEQGVGITSISFNSDYTMTITLSNGSTYTSMSLKGETGPQGPQGETGSGLQILDVYATLTDLQSAHPTGQPGDAYQVGSEGSYTLYIWSSSQSAWVPAGSLGTVSPSVSNPLMDGTASAGSLDRYSRGDHVHPSDTSRASKEELDALIKTSQALIDQSFTYRESPAIQDGLARIDKIKGNTLVWNQLIEKGNMTDGWTFSNSTGSYSDNVLTFTASAQGGFVRPNNPQSIVANHKYLATVDVKGTSAFASAINFTSRNLLSASVTTEWQTFSLVFTNTVTEQNYFPRIYDNRSIGWDAVQIRNCMLFDLTLMGLDITADQFRALFPLPYYQFEQGRLLSFNGTGLKTANADGTAEDTVDLPTLTYFPDGMRSAGTVYDELTPSKAITRTVIYTVTGDSISGASKEANLWRIGLKANYRYNVGGLLYPQGTANIYQVVSSYTEVNETNMSVGFGRSAGDNFVLRNDSFTSADEVKNAFTNNPLQVVLQIATPTETVVDLDLAFNAYEDGTEQLLPVNGSVPSTSPIIADMTYLSIDDAMAYILEKLESIPEQTEQRLEALEDDVADLQTDVGALQPAVSSLQTSVGNINTNIGQLSSTVAGHTSSISDIQSDITDLNTGLDDLEDTVTDNTSRISTLETDLESTDGRVTNLSTSVSGLDSTVTAQGTTVTALDSIITDISNNAVNASLGQHELGFVAAYADATLPANTGTMVTIPKPTIFPSNYTPLFIVGMTTGSYNVSICSIPYGFGTGDSVTCRVWNHGSQQTTQITVYILCMRQRQSQ